MFIFVVVSSLRRAPRTRQPRRQHPQQRREGCWNRRVPGLLHRPGRRWAEQRGRPRPRRAAAGRRRPQQVPSREQWRRRRQRKTPQQEQVSSGSENVRGPHERENRLAVQGQEAAKVIYSFFFLSVFFFF